MSSDSDPQTAGSPFFFILMIAVLLAVWGLITDIIHTGGGGSIDLRNRITGVRVAADHQDPYTYKWSRGDGDRLWDPFDAPSSPLSHTTVTPVTLTLFLPFKELGYRVTQWLWLLVEYAALCFGFFAWTRIAARPLWAWGGLLTCLYCLTPHWRLHVDRGQSYVLYAALLLLMGWIGKWRGKRGLIAEGLAGSLLTMLRPPFVLTLGISAARRKGTAIAAAAGGLALWAVLPVLLAGSAIWKNYFAAMARQSRFYLERITYAPAKFSAKEVIEGIPIDKFLNIPRIPFSDTSIYRLISFQLPPNLLLGGWALLAGLAGFLFIRRRETGTARFYWALSAWIYIGDYLLPAYRYNYNHILLWPMLLLGLGATAGKARVVWQAVSTALLMLHIATWWLPGTAIPWPGVASLAAAAGVALVTLRPGSRADVKLSPAQV